MSLSRNNPTDEQHAMTAAHCVDGRFPNSTFRVVVGCSNRGIDGEGSDREDSVNVIGAVVVSGRLCGV